VQSPDASYRFGGLTLSWAADDPELGVSFRLQGRAQIPRVLRHCHPMLSRISACEFLLAFHLTSDSNQTQIRPYVALPCDALCISVVEFLFLNHLTSDSNQTRIRHLWHFPHHPVISYISAILFASHLRF